MAPASLRRAVAVLLLLAGYGCASVPEVHLAPPIQDVELRGEAGDVEARIVVSWRGVAEQEDTLVLHFRVCVENPGVTPFTLVPASFELVDAALAPVGQPFTGGMPTVVEPGQSSTFDVGFSVPSDPGLERFDLSALVLRTHFQGDRWNWSTNFQRVEPHVHGGPPLWGVSFGVGVGF